MLVAATQVLIKFTHIAAIIADFVLIYYVGTVFSELRAKLLLGTVYENCHSQIFFNVLLELLNSN